MRDFKIHLYYMKDAGERNDTCDIHVIEVVVKSNL